MRLLKYIIIMAGIFACISCNTQGKFTEARVLRHKASIADIKNYLIKQGENDVWTKNVKDKKIKRKMKKLKIDESLVAPAEFVISGAKRRDTIIEFRTSGLWRYEEILLIVTENDTTDRVLKDKGYERYAPGIYYTWHHFPIM